MPGIAKSVEGGKRKLIDELHLAASDEQVPKVKKSKKDKSVDGTKVKKEAKDTVPQEEPALGSNAATSPDAFRKEHDISVKAYGVGTPPLWQSFQEAPFPACLQACLKTAGFTSPSPIQAQAWPLAMTGRDILATAKTGSGKTCGFLLPSIAQLMAQKAAGGSRSGPKPGPTMVIMSPTRELAVQIHQQAVPFARAAGMKSVAVYGGAPKGPQIRDLQSGAEIVIATPGRLNDLLEFPCRDGSSALHLNDVRILVLDEADRMCDMGFEEDIKKIVALMPNEKQTLFFTATWPKAVARVAGTILKNPINVAIGSNDQLRANKDITQIVKVTDQGSKRDLLMQLVKAEINDKSRCIIFSNKKYICDELENTLWEAGYNVAAIHGDKTQQDREWAISQIRAGKMPLLVATDVAARGLDIKDLDRVINFDFPNNTEDYVHRIGRTGRAGATGIAHTFFTDADAKHAGDLVKLMTEAKQEVPPELQAMVGYGGRGRQQGGNRWRGGGRGGGGGGGWGRRW